MTALAAFVYNDEVQEFCEKSAVLQLSDYYPVSPKKFYRDIFPVGSLERLGHQEDGKANAIALMIDEDKSKKGRSGRSRIITDGLEQLPELLKHPFVITSPISYFGKSRRASNASLMYALTLDIDYVDSDNLEHLLSVRFDDQKGYGAIPRPTYLVNSGHGVHLYYVFEQPIPMYPNNQKELLRLKQYLIDITWDKYVSFKPETKECLGLVQGFRMVGSASKVAGCKVEAYKIGKKCTVDWLESFDRANELKLNIHMSKGLSLKQAKEKYPDWYERRIVNKMPVGVPNWRPKRALYDWWKDRAIEKATYGHRYFCVMALAIFAIKCGVSREELEKDANELQEVLTNRGEKPFTKKDMHAALEAYSERYRTFPRASLERLTAIEMPANKRNGRSQAEHLYLARALQKAKDEFNGTNWREGNGRPKGSGTKQQQILDYAQQHPDASQRQIAKELGISLPTVNKWLKAAKDNT